MVKIKSKEKMQISSKNLVLAAMFTAIICVLSQIQIPLQSIPFSLGLLAIFFTGAMLEPKYAFFAVLAYLLLGAAGVPVFANFQGGLQSLLGPTGGYLMSYPLIALIIALFNKRSRRRKLITLTFAMLLSLLLCYIMGTIWFTIITDNSFIAALNICVFPFVLFDLAKIAIAVSLSTVLKKAIAKNIY